MKKLYTILCATLLLFGMGACTIEEEDLFEDSAAQRLNKAVKEYNEILCANENGWALEYFANPNTKGYSLITKFNSNGGVTMAIKADYTGNKYKEVSSLFEIITDNGPVLTFNSYNELLHYFSNPEDIPDTEINEGGYGYGGDYEFILVNVTEDLIQLKGKKYGYDMVMKKLKDGQDWESYFDEIEEFRAKLFSPKVPMLSLVTSKGNYCIENAASGVFSMYPEDGDPITQTSAISYIIQDNGIRFISPFKGIKDDLSLQNFTLLENGTLVCAEDNQAIIKAPQASVFFNNDYGWTSGNAWKFAMNEDGTPQMGGQFKTYYEAIKDGCKNIFKASLDEFKFVYHSKLKSKSLSFKTSRASGAFGIGVEIEDEVANMINFIDTKKMDNNAKAFAKKIPAFTDFLTLLASSTYKATCIDNLRPSTLKFINESQPEDWFIVTIE